MLIGFFLKIIISTSTTVRGQPSVLFHVQAWLPFRNSEMDYFIIGDEISEQQRNNTVYLQRISLCGNATSSSLETPGK